MNDRLQEVIRLRAKGLTVRQIGQEVNLPKSTVHKFLKGIGIRRCEEGFLVHLPYTYFCPNCGREQNHAWLCLECGKFLPAECSEDACYKGFELGQIKFGQQ